MTNPNAALVVPVVLVAFLLGYRFYARWLGGKVFGSDEDFRTPAHEFNDGVDFVPTKRHVLWGHHYTSIAGAAPIVGPAVAVVWGWVPALLWVVVGALFIGCVHDFGALVVSVKNGGRSVADITAKVLSGRARALFLLVVLVLCWIVLAVFALIIAGLFVDFPETVLSINSEILLALFIGLLVHRGGKGLLPASLVALATLYALIWVGVGLNPTLGEKRKGFVDDSGALVVKTPANEAQAQGRDLQPVWVDDQGVAREHPLSFPASGVALGPWTLTPKMTWLVLLFLYCFIASVLPVWVMMQPRDYINSHQLILGLGALILGIFLVQPVIQAPAFHIPQMRDAQGALLPDDALAHGIFPFLFVTIACGAISGFHGLVAGGTTSKQLDRLADARPIGYGGMLGEATLALVATIACTAGFASRELWERHYEGFHSAGGLASSLGAFTNGGARFLREGFGIDARIGAAIMAVLVISFAATTLDTATRIQRYIIAELGAVYRIPGSQNRYLTTGLAVGSALALCLAQSGGKGGLLLWPIFGAGNQMLGALTLLVLSVYFWVRRKPVLPLVLPMLFLMVITVAAMSVNAWSFLAAAQRSASSGDTGFDAYGKNLMLAGLSLILVIINLWIALEALALWRKGRGKANDVPQPEGSVS